MCVCVRGVNFPILHSMPVFRQVLGQGTKFTPQELVEKIGISPCHTHTHTHHLTLSHLADAVSSSDMQRAGTVLMQSNPSMCVIGDLQDVPSKREVEMALFENGGILKKKKSLFSFSS